jgi:hypothetical protein
MFLRSPATLRIVLVIGVLLSVSLACISADRAVPESTAVEESGLTPAGGTRIVYVNSAGVGDIAVRVELPEKPRYPEGAPIVVEVSTWFVEFNGFHRVNETTEIGAITISYLWPGRLDPETGAQSEGEYDFGGPDSLAVLRDVIRFASGLTPDVDGYHIHELTQITPLTGNVGLWASSHSGVVATNVLAYHGQELPTVKYLVGRENPTRDEMYPLELGHFDDRGRPVYNPYYHPDDYTSTTIHVDYSAVGWIQNEEYPEGNPVFSSSGKPAHALRADVHPQMWGKWYYSRDLTQALLDNGALTLENWPDHLATPAEAQAAWPYRTTVDNYPKLATTAPDLKVMLVFAALDHVQAALDKPHIHQAYDGFQGAAGLWVRMNPDRVYVEQIRGSGPFGDYPDNAANTEPADWSDARPWGYRNELWTRKVVWLAAVAEMADRVQADNWSPNLEQTLFDMPQ